jgi:tetratricopeptide (TPR) repeat protein
MKTIYALFLLLFAATAFAQSDVGEVAFANTGAEAAQPAFRRGLALLHNFEYASAAESFREAQKIDPGFVMAYWGEAMTETHPIWFQQDLEAARTILKRLGDTPEARAKRAKSDRERDYLATLEVLYGEGTKEDRDDRYAEAMAALQRKYPDDVDATAFHALALLGTSHEGRDVPTYMRAAALLEEVFPEHRKHPGVLHYLIHAYDDPVHAPLGMRAARLYGAVAPNAGHALHMTSHIFIAMGMWDDVIDANRRAIEVVNKERAARDRSPHECGHYPTWLHYGLLQKGLREEANRGLAACRQSAFDPNTKGMGPSDTQQARVTSWAEMVASHVMGGGTLDAAQRAEIPGDKFPRARFTIAYADAIAAARRGDRAALDAAATTLRAVDQELSGAHGSHAGMPGMAGMMGPDAGVRRAIVLQQVEALRHAAAGKREEAVALLRKAAATEQAMPFEFGPPPIEKPTFELLGEQLLALKRPAEAAEAFRAALARAPGRTASAEGLRASLGTSAPAQHGGH